MTFNTYHSSYSLNASPRGRGILVGLRDCKDRKLVEAYIAIEEEDSESRILILIVGYGALFLVTCPPLRLFFSYLYHSSR